MLGYKKGNTKLLTGQIPLHYSADRVYLDGDTTKSVQDKCARKADLTNLDLTGTTNTTGSTIAIGTYFYLNGTLVRAKTAIANGATFTLNTNYEVVTVGGLNELNNEINRGSVAVTASGDTFKSLLNKLKNLVDFSKVSINTKLGFGSAVYNSSEIGTSRLIYTTALAFSTTEITSFFIYKNSDCSAYDWSNGTYIDISNNSVANGTAIRLYY